MRNGSVVAATLIGAIGCGLIAAARPAHAANPDICPPAVSSPEPRAAAAGPAEDLVLAFAKAIASGAGGRVFGFVMSQLGLGDRTPDQLAEISAQLARMDAKLDTLQGTANEIKQRVNQAAFTALMLQFRKLQADVESINTHGMRPVALAAANLAKVLSTPASTPEQIAEARQCLDEKRANFRTMADSRKADTNVVNIRNLMSSVAGEDQLVNGYGRLLTQNSRNVTPEHSAALRAFYDYLEQYQALAAIQRAEWQLAARTPRKIVEETSAEFYDESSMHPGWIQSQRAVLPDAIPVLVLIHVGTAADTTLGKPMLFAAGGDYGLGPELTTWRDPDPKGVSTAPAEAVRVASTFEIHGLKNWRVISARDWDSLVAGKPAAQTGAAYLNALFEIQRAPFGEQSFLWIDTPPRLVQVRLDPNTTRWDFPVHQGIRLGRSGSLAVGGPAAEWRPWRPALPEKVKRNQSREVPRIVAEAFDGAQGRLILSRETDVNYMAVKNSP